MGDSIISDGFEQGDPKYLLAKFSEGDTVWVKGDKDVIWDMGKVIAALTKSEDDMVVVKTNSGRDVLTRKVFGGEVIPVGDGKAGYADMTAMRFVNEPQILENLRVRSYHDQPYTFLGPVLVAVNPLSRLAAMDKFKAGQKNVINSPHPFAIAELAYQQMLFAVRRPGGQSETPINQTVIVSGESGAGKTVSSKLVLQHLVARSGGGALADAMLASNPITESFGNAKTLRNPNSSRFGKMFRVLYDEEGALIVGATVGTYLLERSRITTHEVGERNFHIFYELLQGASDKMLNQLHLKKGFQYNAMLPHTKEASEKVVAFLEVDKANFEAVMNSLKVLGFEEQRVMDLFGAVSAVLHLSNIEFDALDVSGNDASRVSDATREHLNHAAELLGVHPTEFEKVMIELERKVGASLIKSPVSAVHAGQLLEGISKALYSRIFQFMVITVNLYINKSARDDLPMIGVLDIFGFETFKKNDLEQLLINYTNEALQLTFNKQVLEAEASLYEREKLAMTEQDRMNLDPSQVVDQSNKLCIDLLQGVVLEDADQKKSYIPGLLDVIHEQGRVPSPSEKKMLEKMHKTFAGKDMYPNYMVKKKNARTDFIVKHYAGKVTYTSGNFLLKNVDSLPKTANELFLSATKETTRAIWDAGNSILTNKKASIVSTFKTQITELNNDLNATQCSFIRCMKPNAEMQKSKEWFSRRYITMQLRNLSVPKTADVLKAGLPTRIAYDQLVQRYSSIFNGAVKIPDVDNERGLKSFIAALFFAFETPRSCYKLGLTKVFFKSGDLDKLEEILSAADSWSRGNLDATSEAERKRVIERFRKYLLKRRWLVVFATMYAGQQFVNLLVAQRRRKELERVSAILLQSKLRMFVARKKYRVMLHAKKLEEERIAREKAEAERKERERLAEIARQKELEKQAELKKFLEERREKERKQKEKYAKMINDFRKANKEVVDIKTKEKEAEMKRIEKERREAEEKARREEAERQRVEIEKAQKEREEQERLAAEAAEAARIAKQAYEEKLMKEEKERMMLEAQKAATAAEKEDVMKYIENKLQRDQEKLEEKMVIEQVVDELMAREERKNMRVFVEEEEDDVMDDENPWFFYEDLDLDEIDNISHDSHDEARINEALQFLDNLADDSEDEDYESDSDLESRDDERNNQVVKHSTVKNMNQATFKDYTGPFIVNVHFPKLEDNSAKKKKFNMKKNNFQPWKQCFAFVYPAHDRVLLHHGTNTTMKVQFNPRGNQFPAMIKKTDTFQKKNHVIYVTGVRLMEKDEQQTEVDRHLIISFQDDGKRAQFLKLLSHFVMQEDDPNALTPVKPKAAPEATAGGGKLQASSRMQNFTKREDRRDMLRKQNYTKFALLNRAVKNGKISKDKVQGMLLGDQDEEEEDYNEK